MLQGRRVRLEPLRLHDAARLWPAAQATDWRWMSRPVDGPADLAAWIDARLDAACAGTALPFVQVRVEDGEAVGCTALQGIDARHRRAAVGNTWLAPTARRTGVNLEAKLLLLRQAFGPLGLERVEFRTDAENEASRRSLEALGATEEGTLRRHVRYPDGRRGDTVVYSVLREEWGGVEDRIEARLEARLGARPD